MTKAELIDQRDNSLIEKVSELRVKYLSENFEISQADKNVLYRQNVAFLKANLNHTLYVSVVIENEKVVSSCYLSLNSRSPNTMIVTGVYGEIYGVYKHPEYRHRGYAKSCVSEIIKTGRSHPGLSCLLLDASSEGEHLYEELGFERIDEAYSSMVLTAGYIKVGGKVKKIPITRRYQELEI